MAMVITTVLLIVMTKRLVEQGSLAEDWQFSAPTQIWQYAPEP